MYREANGPWEMREAVREQIRRGAAFVKFMATGARSVVDEDPEPAQMTQEEMVAIVDEAHRMGKRVAAHAEGLQAQMAIEAGADRSNMASPCTSPDLLAAMASRGVVLVPTLSPSRLANASRTTSPQCWSIKQSVNSTRPIGPWSSPPGRGDIVLGYDSGQPGARLRRSAMGEAGSAPSKRLPQQPLRRRRLGRADSEGWSRSCADCRRNGRPDEDLTLLASPDNSVRNESGEIIK